MEKLKQALWKIPRSKYIFLLFVALYFIFIIIKGAGGLSELGQAEQIAAYVVMGFFSLLSAGGILISAYALLTGQYLENQNKDGKEE